MTHATIGRSLAIVVFTIATSATSAAERHTGGDSKLQRWSNLPHAHREVALVSIYGPFDVQPSGAMLAGAKPAVEVFDFEEVILAEDGKGIALRVRDRERNVLRQLAQKHSGKWFVAVAPPRDIYRGEPLLAGTRITPEMAKGELVFPHPQCAAIAESLRRRFRIADFRLEPR